MSTAYSMNIQILLMVATLTCLVVTANGLTCYSCDSITNGDNCGDPFSSVGISSANCSSGQTCFKGKAEILGVEFVSRGCGTYGTDCAEVSGVEYCSCSTDECNSSTIATVSGALFLIACTIAHLV